MIENSTGLLLAVSTALIALNIYIIWRQIPKKSKLENSIVLDTSALIDGRIIEVVRSGFVPSNIVIPRFVIAELQLLADKADHTKRERARFGLGIVKELQDSKLTNVSIVTSDSSPENVDEKLVELSLKNRWLLLTTDFNLLKVAEIQGVRILNINELAQNLRPVYLPGERKDLKIVQKGQERDQGVGYLEDGTMVVVEAAKGAIGKTLNVEFTRNLQTSAGRMMFAEKVDKGVQSRQSAKKPANKAKSRVKRFSAEDRLIDTINSQ